MTAAGNYTLKGTFTLLKPSNHTNYYGLVFGGQGLEGADQRYTYFTVAQDGTFLIKQRTGEMTRDVKGYTPNAAVKKPDATGKSVNALEVRVTGDTVSYVVNGTVVHTTPKSGMTGWFWASGPVMARHPPARPTWRHPRAGRRRRGRQATSILR